MTKAEGGLGEAPAAGKPLIHASGCAVNNMPARPTGPCDCGAADAAFDLSNVLDQARAAAPNPTPLGLDT